MGRRWNYETVRIENPERDVLRIESPDDKTIDVMYRAGKLHVYEKTTQRKLGEVEVGGLPTTSHRQDAARAKSQEKAKKKSVPRWVEGRLAKCEHGAKVRALLRRYLLEVQQLDARIRLVPARRWEAIEIRRGDRHVVRVFPIDAIVQVDSRVPNSKARRYGPKVELTKKGLWRVEVRSKDDVAALRRCTSDAIIHADGRRVLPP